MLSPAAVIDLDITVFFQLALVLVLLVVLNGLLFRPLLGLFEQRRTATVEREREAARLGQEADVLSAAYDREMALATAAGMDVRNRKRDEGLRREAEMLARERVAAAEWLEGRVCEHAREVEGVRSAAEPEIERLGGELAGMLARPGPGGRGRGE